MLWTVSAISLKQAREKREEAKTLLAAGADPGELKKADKQAEIAKIENTFEALGREWFARNSQNWTEAYRKRVIFSIENNLFPFIGAKDISEIKTTELLEALRFIESRGALDPTRRILQTAGRIFRYGIATGRCEYDITASLQGALPPAKVEHFPSITEPKKVGELIRTLDTYQGQFSVLGALKLSPLVFLRPSELRKAEWAEFDFDANEWRITKNRMKMRIQHIAPLAAGSFLDIKKRLMLNQHKP